MSSSGESLLSARLPLALVDEREAYGKATVTVADPRENRVQFALNVDNWLNDTNVLHA